MFMNEFDKRLLNFFIKRLLN